MPPDLDLPSRLDRLAERLTTPCGDGAMVWRCWGAGAPIVLLHGGHGSWEHWIRNIAPLAERGRVIAGDLPGLGDSDPAPPPHGADEIAAIVAEGIRLLLPEGPFAIAGFSLGSVIAARVARRFGARVSRLFLLGIAGLGDGWRSNVEGARKRPYDASPDLQRAAVRHNLAISMLADPARIDELAVDVQYRLTARRRGLIGLPISGSGALVDALPEFVRRARVIVGEHDPYLLPDVPRRLARLQAAWPDLSITMVPGAGHWVAYEAADAVNALLGEAVGD